jgi:hypothetical protein
MRVGDGAREAAGVLFTGALLGAATVLGELPLQASTAAATAPNAAQRITVRRLGFTTTPLTLAPPIDSLTG